MAGRVGEEGGSCGGKLTLVAVVLVCLGLASGIGFGGVVSSRTNFRIESAGPVPTSPDLAGSLMTGSFANPYGASPLVLLNNTLVSGNLPATNGLGPVDSGFDARP